MALARLALVGASALGLTVALAVRPSPASNGSQAVAINARAGGRGGIDAALGDGATAQEANPALLGWMGPGSTEVAVGLRRDVTYYQTPRAGYGRGGPGRWNPIPTFATVFEPESVYGHGDRWRWGFGAYPGAAGGGLLIASLGPSFAYRVSERLSLGLGLRYLATRAEVEADGGVATGSSGAGAGDPRAQRPGGIVRIQPSGTPLRINGETLTFAELFSLASGGGPGGPALKVDAQGWGHGGTALLGLAWRPDRATRVGLSYRDLGLVGPVRGEARVDATEGFANLQRDLQAAQSVVLSTFLPAGGVDGRARYDFEVEGFRIPRQAVLGLARDLPRGFRASGEAKWIQWSQAMREAVFRLEGGDNPDLNEINGGPDFTARIPLHWRDQYVAAAGLEWESASGLVLRGGHSVGTNPVPANTVLVGGSGFAQHHGTLGAGYRREAWVVDLAWEHAWQETISTGTSRSSADADGARQKLVQDVILVSYERRF
ncbi:MAG: outer membrane protein transport protein [Planctomycetes bacterium]|nr:outer membrane protein transport protein [Planctomycetota bacterium]